MTVQELLRELRQTIGGESAPLDASLLLADQLGLRREQLYTDPARTLTGGQLDGVRQLALRRAAGEPIAYLLGRKGFYGRDFRVDRRALIPRPDTEALVEDALTALDARRGRSERSLKVLDLCCGSGCIGISLAAEHPSIELVLADIDPDALELAAENAKRILPPQQQPRYIVSDVFADIDERFDVIVTNPPYVSEAEYTELGMHRWLEPRHALAATDSGLEVIRRIVDRLVGYMYPNGYVAIEAADHQAEVLAAMLADTPLTGISHRHDIAGRRRVTTALFPG